MEILPTIRLNSLERIGSYRRSATATKTTSSHKWILMRITLRRLCRTHDGQELTGTIGRLIFKWMNATIQTVPQRKHLPPRFPAQTSPILTPPRQTFFGFLVTDTTALSHCTTHNPVVTSPICTHALRLPMEIFPIIPAKTATSSGSL